MLAEEGEALAKVAGIGLERLRRQPPLGAQMRQPARDLKRNGLVGAGEFNGLSRGGGFGHGTVFGVIPKRLYRTCFVYRSLICAKTARRTLAPAVAWS
jgi:hypothetical protein